MNFDLRKPLALFVMLIALVVAGCGGDDGEEETTETETEALSAEEYEQELGDILAPLGTELQEIGAATQAGTSDEDAVAGVEEASATLDGAIGDLSAIEPPEEAAEGHDMLITSLEAFKGAADDFAATDLEDMAAVQEALTAFQESVITFQEDFQAGATQLQEAGIEPQSPTAP